MSSQQNITVYSPSLEDFCQFVDHFTQTSPNPQYTMAVCEDQAETVRITSHDVTLETIDLLLDTLLKAIDHLETKRLHEQQRRRWMVRVKTMFQSRKAC